jgi:hypothetical protein
MVNHVASDAADDGALNAALGFGGNRGQRQERAHKNYGFHAIILLFAVYFENAPDRNRVAFAISSYMPSLPLSVRFDLTGARTTRNLHS